MRAVPRTSSLSDALFVKLEEEIRGGRFSPGDRLPTEKEMAEREGVSRTVVREAVARLSAQGLAQARHGSGLYVSAMAGFPAFQISPDELTEVDDLLKLLELRGGVEAEMASLAALRRTEGQLREMRACLTKIEEAAATELAVEADAEFHAVISRAAGNVYFERFLEFLGARLVPPRSLLLEGQPAEAHHAYARVLAIEHDEIFVAIAEKDQVRAQNAARQHMTNSFNRHAMLTRRGGGDSAKGP